MLRHSLVVPTWLAIILSVIGMIGTVLASYHTADVAITSRVTALEAHQTDRDAKVDHIQVQVDKLVDWMIGKQ